MMMETKEPNLQEEPADLQRQSTGTLKIITEKGVVIDTAEWLTIKRYAQRYGLSHQVVINWINRGVIPPDCYAAFPELKGLRLVKDQTYK